MGMRVEASPKLPIKRPLGFSIKNIGEIRKNLEQPSRKTDRNCNQGSNNRDKNR
uniref:Uncharacterized protein n=1 Tax=Solanum tuberosum TaxID=4113 RepID=M0ZUJ0_SOLTU